jgi:RNA polymerase sigma-70 factor (ECF subfamily)
MLRYFGSYDSYDEVAAQLGVPIGTVRSRLAEVKVKLADELLASAGLVDHKTIIQARERSTFWTEALRRIFQRGDADQFVMHFEPDLRLSSSNGTSVQGRKHLAAEIESDIAAGVWLDPKRVLAAPGLAIVEARFVNPPENPAHCPPGIALVIVEGTDRARAIRMHLSPRPPRADET